MSLMSCAETFKSLIAKQLRDVLSRDSAVVKLNAYAVMVSSGLVV